MDQLVQRAAALAAIGNDDDAELMFEAAEHIGKLEERLAFIEAWVIDPPAQPGIPALRSE